MPLTEAQREDLYTGMEEVLGPRRAELFMSQMSQFDLQDFRNDLREFRAEIRSDMTEFRAEMRNDMKVFQAEIRNDMKVFHAESRKEMKDLRTELRTEIGGGLAAVNQRIDRLFLALLIAMFGIIAALIGIALNLP